MAFNQDIKWQETFLTKIKSQLKDTKELSAVCLLQDYLHEYFHSSFNQSVFILLSFISIPIFVHIFNDDVVNLFQDFSQRSYNWSPV